MKYNPHFKDSRDMFVTLGVTSRWEGTEHIDPLVLSYFISICRYLEELFPEHPENLLDMEGAEVVEYLNKTTGLCYSVQDTQVEAFSGYLEALRKLSFL